MGDSFPTLATYSLQHSARDRDEPLRYAANSASRSDLEIDPFSIALTDGTSTTRRPRRISSSHRRLVFTDPVAFRYLEEDESTEVLARRHKLEGYELYVVEQWVVSRTQPTFTICTFTGDPSNSILVNVLAVPQDPSSWSKRLRVYFDAISQSYAREKETHLGALMVTNLSGFPSALNVIAVPDGDVRKHREDFIVNEDLKRMGCAGRAGMSLQYPQASTITKFHHMYRTSEKVPLYASVMETVRYCQVALVLYGKLEATYADGLLCDITEKSVNEWWNEIGTDFHNIEPSDGILGPTTVSALIGLLIGAYNRLKETGAPVGKDPMDISSMKRAISHFQKVTRMDRTRRLDRATLDRLHRVTANKADDEGMAVTRALKSTVAGLSGKGGEMIARGFGGGKEKAGIAEVETLDIERLSQLVTGRSMKWLWQGKEKGLSSAVGQPPIDELNGRVFSVDDQGNFIWTSGDKNGVDDLTFMNGIEPEDREKRRRLKDAVGLSSHRGHISRHHTDDDPPRAGRDHSTVSDETKESAKEPLGQQSSRSSIADELPTLNRALADAPVNTSRLGQPKATELASEGKRVRSNTAQSAHRQALRGLDHRGRESPSKRLVRERITNIRHDLEGKRYQEFAAAFQIDQPQARPLRRSRSAIQLRSVLEGRQARLPRHLSFSLVSDVIEYTPESESSDADNAKEPQSISAQVVLLRGKLRNSQDLGSKVYGLRRGIVPFAESRIEQVEHIRQEADGHLEELNTMYYQHLEEYQTLQATSTDLVAREKSSLTEAMRSIDMLGQKLDYEIESLQSRMQEVEESVDDFERRVLEIEAIVKTLVAKDERPQQAAWYERWLGIGKGQKIPQKEEEQEKEDVITQEVPGGFGNTEPS